jgi:hypothetical protein
MVYFSLYLLARNAPGLINATAAVAADSGGQLDSLESWEFYLDRAVNTTLAMWNITGGLTGYAQYGLMVGSGFGLVMDAAALEGAADKTSPFQWGERAAAIDAILQQRVALWASLPFPFGSEVSFLVPVLSACSVELDLMIVSLLCCLLLHASSPELCTALDAVGLYRSGGNRHVERSLWRICMLELNA